MVAAAAAPSSSPVADPLVGWLAVLTAVVCFGSFAAPAKTKKVVDANVHRNKLFAGWNHVLFAYCDGGSFSGDATQPLSWPSPTGSGNTTLYFRGRRVLRHLIQELLTKYGMSSAQEVLLAGGSAGGLAVYLQADFVASLLPPTVGQLGAMPVSGFFLMHRAANGQLLYPDEMRHVGIPHAPRTLLPSPRLSVCAPPRGAQLS